MAGLESLLTESINPVQNSNVPINNVITGQAPGYMSEQMAIDAIQQQLMSHDVSNNSVTGQQQNGSQQGAVINMGVVTPKGITQQAQRVFIQNPMVQQNISQVSRDILDTLLMNQSQYRNEEHVEQYL